MIPRYGEYFYFSPFEDYRFKTRSDLKVEKDKSSDPSVDWTNVFSTVAAATGTIITTTATIASIIQGLDVIERRWREKHTMHEAQHRDTQQGSDSEIIAIRLLLSDGTQAQFKIWLDEPDELRKFIDAFNQPSSSLKPLQAIFLPRQGRALIVDVTRGAKDNDQLDVLLSYLNVDQRKNNTKP